MKLVIHPAVDDARLEKIRTAAAPMSVVNVDDAPTAVREIVDADAFFGKLTPELLAAACQATCHPLTLRMQPGHDHSYYFIATFLGDHFEHHGRFL